MPHSDLLPRRDLLLQCRISSAEMAALDSVARRLSVPRSQVVRAAIGAVVRDPPSVWLGPLRVDESAELALSPGQGGKRSAPSGRSRRNRKRR